MIPLPAALKGLIDRLTGGVEVTPSEFQQAIYDTRYTGADTVHCFNGVPQQVDFHNPVRVTICAGKRKGVQLPAVGLDTPLGSP